MTYFIIWIVEALIMGFVCDRIVNGKGYPRNINHDFIWGFLLNLIGLIVCLSKPAYSKFTQNQSLSADELMKYKQLFDAGVLTQEEFIKKKEELLK